MMTRIETRGRKPIPYELRKPPQTTYKINKTILPFVKELKSNLKKGKVTKKTLIRLFNVLNNHWVQTDSTDEGFSDQLNVSTGDAQRLENEVKRLQEKLLELNQAKVIKPLQSTKGLS